MYAERFPCLTKIQFLLLNSIFVRRINSSSTPSLNFAICGKTVPGPFRRAAPSTITFKSFLGSINIEFGGATDLVIGGVGVCFWVESGEIVAPIETMRFDDTFYRFFGSELESVGSKVEIIPDVLTYGQRNLGVVTCPGILSNKFQLTL